jgi:hypothetical protein
MASRGLYWMTFGGLVGAGVLLLDGVDPGGYPGGVARHLGVEAGVAPTPGINILQYTVHEVHAECYALLAPFATPCL